MTKKKEPKVLAYDPTRFQGKLKPLGGSKSDDWNNLIVNQAARSIWCFAKDDGEYVHQKRLAVVDALAGIGPRDELEGMLAAQLVACHNASMECHRRAMLNEQTFEGRRENLSQANKLSRTYASLLETLNRHRGKGQQKVTVEHVHVHEGGQAIVGNVENPGGGFASRSKEQPHGLTHAPGQTMPGEDAPRDGVSVARDEERPLPAARRTIDRSTEGQS